MRVVLSNDVDSIKKEIRKSIERSIMDTDWAYDDCRLENNGLIIAGSLVGASGIILTSIMSKGMNRSHSNVIFGAMGSDDGQASQPDG